MSVDELNKPAPYKLHISDELLNLTKQKLQLARFPEEQTDVGDDDWSQGAKVKVVKRLAEYWSNGYDWRAEEVNDRAPWVDVRLLTTFKARINAEFNQFKVKIDIPDYGPQVLHYAHHTSPSPDAIPLLFVQGGQALFSKPARSSSHLPTRQTLQFKPSMSLSQAYQGLVRVMHPKNPV